MKARHALLGAALLGSGWLALSGGAAPDTAVVEAAPRARPPRAGAPPAAPAIAALLPRDRLVGASADRGGAFAQQSWTPPPPPPPPPAPVAAPVETGPPPLPFTYIGKQGGDEGWEVYVARGEQAHILRERVVIDGQYRVDAVAQDSVTFTYLPLNQQQVMYFGRNR